MGLIWRPHRAVRWEQPSWPLCVLCNTHQVCQHTHRHTHTDTHIALHLSDCLASLTFFPLSGHFSCLSDVTRRSSSLRLFSPLLLHKHAQAYTHIPQAQASSYKWCVLPLLVSKTHPFISQQSGIELELWWSFAKVNNSLGSEVMQLLHDLWTQTVIAYLASSAGERKVLLFCFAFPCFTFQFGVYSVFDVTKGAANPGYDAWAQFCLLQYMDKAQHSIGFVKTSENRWMKRGYKRWDASIAATTDTKQTQKWSYCLWQIIRALAPMSHL